MLLSTPLPGVSFFKINSPCWFSSKFASSAMSSMNSVTFGGFSMLISTE